MHCVQSLMNCSNTSLLILSAMGALLAGECGLKHFRRHAVPCCAVLLLQVPNLDAAVSTKQSIKQRGIGKSLRMLLAGLTDLARTAVGQEPIYLPLAGKNSTACHPSCLISSIWQQQRHLLLLTTCADE